MAVIFVYGTLKRGEENHRYLEGQVFLAETRTEPGYRMYMIDEYPGMIAVPADGLAVAGELWQIDDDTLRRIDVLEGTKVGLYRRAPVRLEPPHNDAGAETYFYARSVEGCKDLGATFSLAGKGPDPHQVLGAHPHRAPRPPSSAEIAIDAEAEAEEPSPMD